MEALFGDEEDPADLSALSVLGGRRMERVSEAERRGVCAGDILCLPGLG